MGKGIYAWWRSWDISCGRTELSSLSSAPKAVEMVASLPLPEMSRQATKSPSVDTSVDSWWNHTTGAGLGVTAAAIETEELGHVGLKKNIKYFWYGELH